MSKSPARLIVESLTEPLYKLYSSSVRVWEYAEMNFLVMPGVFHPGWFVTSRMLLDKIETLDLEGKQTLELGCGTGVQACLAAKLGAHSHALDVTPIACKNAALNAERNGLSVQVYASDIFDSLPHGVEFDYIFVNPPFLPRYPEGEKDFAFCCGEEYEYYICLFSDLRRALKPAGTVLMALSKSCDIERILAVAESENLNCQRVDQYKRYAEINYLYEIKFNSQES